MTLKHIKAAHNVSEANGCAVDLHPQLSITYGRSEIDMDLNPVHEQSARTPVCQRSRAVVTNHTSSN